MITNKPITIGQSFSDMDAMEARGPRVLEFDEDYGFVWYNSALPK
jgi:hypothetical protein